LSAKPLAQVERADLTQADWEKELDSPHYWHRQTAERLLREQYGDQAPALAKRRLHLSDLRVTTPQREFILTLRREDTLLRTDLNAVRQLAKLSQTLTNQRVLLQLALSLGYSSDQEAVLALSQLARRHASIRWMPEAILTGVSGRTVPMLTGLLREPGRTGHLLLEPLGTVIGARSEAAELTTALTAVAACKTRPLQAAVLKGITSTVKPLPLPLAAKQALQALLASGDLGVQGQAVALAGKLQIADAKALTAIREKARTDAANSVLPTEGRLAAVALLSGAPDSLAAPALLAAWATATPPVRSAILDALIAKGKRIKPLLEAMQAGSVSLNAFSPSQRTQLLERADGHLRPRLEAEFAKAVQPDKEALFARYAQALDGARDAVHGGELFKQMCASCHRVNQVGTAVGPDLKNAYANSRQTLLRSILWPNEKITSSYELYLITTTSGEQQSGVLVSESASSVVLRQAGGREQTLLRKDIQSLTSSPTSLMPEYGEALSPKDCADIIEWLKTSLAVK
jgi:putative heme-binding domain-containing protein